jgi:hypothetical protein
MDTDPIDDHLIDELQRCSHVTGWRTTTFSDPSEAVFPAGQQPTSLGGLSGIRNDGQQTGKGILARFPQEAGEFHAAEPKILCAGRHDRRRRRSHHGLKGTVPHLRE